MPQYLQKLIKITAAPLGFAGSAVGFLANLAQAAALFGAVYAFLYPGEAARAVVSFEDHLFAAREDLSRVASAIEATVVNTGRTADNTDRIAAAIPNWVVFNGGIIRFEVNERSGFYVMNRQSLLNPSNQSVDLVWRVYAGEDLIVSDATTVMPLEEVSLIWREFGEADIVICLSGRSSALSGTFYEKRIFGASREAPLRGFDPIEGC